MIPGEVPDCLKNLSIIEEAVIQRISPILQVYVRRGGNDFTVLQYN